LPMDQTLIKLGGKSGGHVSWLGDGRTLRFTVRNGGALSSVKAIEQVLGICEAPVQAPRSGGP
ncbi:hypothetical protein ACFOOT_11980, partial [Novosphingobium pokkalii]